MRPNAVVAASGVSSSSSVFSYPGRGQDLDFVLEAVDLGGSGEGDDEGFPFVIEGDK